MDKLAQNTTYKLTKSEYLRYRSIWCLQLNNSGNNVPIATRPDDRAAVALKNHLYSKFGKIIRSRSHHKIKTEYEKATNSQKLTVKELESTRKLGGNSGHLHILQASGRVINGTWKEYWSKMQDLIQIAFHFVAGRISSTVDEIHCNRRWGVDRTHLTRDFFHGSRIKDCVKNKLISPQVIRVCTWAFRHPLALTLHLGHSLPLPRLLL